MNAISPTQAAYRQLDAWSQDYERRLREQRAAHIATTRANPVAFGLALLESVGENPMAWALAVESVLSEPQRDGDIALRILVTSALVSNAENEVDCVQPDLFGVAA